MNNKRILTAIGIIWAFGLLFLYWQQTQNGRYSLDSTGSYILDTRNGATYEVEGDANKPPKTLNLPIK